MTFRFDDVCCNADMTLIEAVTSHIRSVYPSARIVYGVSPLIHNDCGERVYPKVLNAMSDYREFFKPERACVPEIKDKSVELAGHGLVHIDHRLLDKQTQELSILASCSLVNGKIFIPPFNKWNKDTFEICHFNGIELIRFETGWLSCEHNKFYAEQRFWYLHAREWTIEKFKEWLR